MASEEIKKALIESGLKFAAADEPITPDPGCTACTKGCVYTGCYQIVCMATGCRTGCMYSSCSVTHCDKGCNEGCYTIFQIIGGGENA